MTERVSHVVVQDGKDWMYLFLGHAAMKFGCFDAEETEDDADSVGYLFLAEEDYGVVCVDVLAEVHEVA